jgi:hypothetical protein
MGPTSGLMMALINRMKDPEPQKRRNEEEIAV